MNATTTISTENASAKLAFQLYVAVGIAVFLLMMLVGAVFRAAQAEWLPVPVNYGYELMTLHGAGMVGVAGLAGAAVMWYFLRRYVALSTAMFLAMLGLSLAGVVMILAAIGLGRFAGAWTFLYPLPARSMGVWSPHAAAAFVGGLILVGVGFLLFYLDCALALMRRYGSLARSLGLDQLFGSGPLDTSEPAPRSKARRHVRRFGTVLLVVGLVAIAYGLTIYLWRDPATDLWARWKQHELSGKLEQEFVQERTALLPPDLTREAVDGAPVAPDVLAAAVRRAAGTLLGPARPHQLIRCGARVLAVATGAAGSAGSVRIA